MPPAARISDMHTCPVPTHVGGPTLVGDVTVLIGHMPAARVGDALVCATGPDTISRGESTVKIGHRDAARLGDATTHGGVIVAGCPTVLIGGSAQIEALKTDKPICEECEKAKNTTLLIERKYHDDEPVQQAEFEVELFDGKIIKGKLDKEGRARIEGVPPEIHRIRFGPDPRPYTPKPGPPNPMYRATLSDAEIEAMVAQRAGRTRHPGRLAPHPPGIAIPALAHLAEDAFEWIWGTLLGEFNEGATPVQLLVDITLGMFEGIGEVLAARDFLAITIRLALHPERRKEPLQWILWTVNGLGMIPLVGPPLRGIGGLLKFETKAAARNLRLFRGLLRWLKRIGEGNAVKYLKEMKFKEHIPELTARALEFLRRVQKALDTWKARVIEALGAIAVEFRDEILRRLEELRKGIEALAAVAEQRIKEAVQELDKQFEQVLRGIEEAEWETVPSSLKSWTREAEARLVSMLEAVLLPEPGRMPFPPAKTSSYVHVDGWPDLREEKFATWGAIRSFSGPITAVHLDAGTKIWRVVPYGETAMNVRPCWLRKLPDTGPEWRKDYAVLEKWNRDGGYIELEIPGDGLRAWEGKAASQYDGDPDSPTCGQLLPGGGIQLIVDLDLKENEAARKIVEGLKHQRTGYTGLRNVNVPGRRFGLLPLGAHEVSTKVGPGSHELEAAVEPTRDETTGGRP